jgi:hypothetical protein
LLTLYSAAPAVFHVPITAGTPAPVRIAGSATDVTLINADGTVTGGTGAAAGAGALALVTVQPGLAVISEDGPRRAAGIRHTVPVPGSIALAGQNEQLLVSPGPARLIHLETDAPVVLRDSVTGMPQLFTAGAAVNLFQPKGQPLLLDLQAAGGALSGNARLETIAAVPVSDGLGPPVRVAPGQSRLFTFTLAQPRSIGVGVRGSVDDALCRLLGADGAELGRGVIAMNQLPPGTYFLAVDVPANGVATDIQPVLVGKTLPYDGPPPDVQASYRALAGQPQN